jgi:Flp pilus assembly protein TadG
MSRLNESQRNRRARDQRGSSLVETALVFAFLLVPLLFVTLDFGQWFYYSIEIQNAAQSAAQYGAQNISDSTGITTTADNDAHNITGLGVSVNYGCECPDGTQVTAGTSANPCSAPPSCAVGSTPVNYVQVLTSKTYSPMIPWTRYIGAPSSITLNGQAWVRSSQQ